MPTLELGFVEESVTYKSEAKKLSLYKMKKELLDKFKKSNIIWTHKTDTLTENRVIYTTHLHLGGESEGWCGGGVEVVNSHVLENEAWPAGPENEVNKQDYDGEEDNKDAGAPSEVDVELVAAATAVARGVCFTHSGKLDPGWWREWRKRRDGYDL